jgi:hypothetical protein
MMAMVVVMVVVQQYSDMAVESGQGRGQQWSECSLLVLRKYCVGAFWLHQAGARALEHRRFVE